MRVLIMLIGFLMVTAYAAADEKTEGEKALAKLNQQLTLIKAIEPYIEVQDFGRLRLLEKRTASVKLIIETAGYANRETYRAYDVLIITYRNSAQFFESIVTDESKNDIDKLQAVSKEIVADVGEPSGGRITFIVFEDLKKKLDELGQRGGSEELSVSIRELLPHFGRTIAVAQEQLDTPPTFDLSVPLTEKITKDLYPHLKKISESDDGFSLAVDIMGLVEFYLEFIGK